MMIQRSTRMGGKSHKYSTLIPVNTAQEIYDILYAARQETHAYGIHLYCTVIVTMEEYEKFCWAIYDTCIRDITSGKIAPLYIDIEGDVQLLMPLD